MKRIAGLALALVMVFCAAGCGKSAAGENTQPTPAPSPTVTVEEYYSKQAGYTDSSGNNWAFDFRIPKLTGSSKAAVEINGEIEGKYEYYAKNELKKLKTRESAEYLSIGWYARSYKNVLSLIIYAHTMMEASEYSVFCCDAVTGERFYGNDDLLKALGTTENDAAEATRSAAREYFERGNSGVPEAQRKEFGYDEALKRTVSDEYVRDGAMLYPDTDGQYVAILPVASMAGSDWYYRELCLPLGAVSDTVIKPVSALHPEDCPPAFEEAVQIIKADKDVQEDEAVSGMDMMDGEETQYIMGEQCAVAAAGTGHETNFVRERYYAVSSSGAIYRYDVISDSWEPVNTLARIYSNGDDTAMFVVFTDPGKEEYWCGYDGEEGKTGMMLMPLSSGARMKVDRVRYDEAKNEFIFVETVREIDKTIRGQVIHLDIEPTETLPEYRISAEYAGSTAQWYVIYDGSGENGSNYAQGVFGQMVS